MHIIWIEHGPDACRRFINNCQRTVNSWLLANGMSIGIGDTVADVNTMKKVNEIIEDVSGSRCVRLLVGGWWLADRQLGSGRSPVRLGRPPST